MKKKRAIEQWKPVPPSQTVSGTVRIHMEQISPAWQMLSQSGRYRVMELRKKVLGGQKRYLLTLTCVCSVWSTVEQVYLWEATELQ